MGEPEPAYIVDKVDPLTGEVYSTWANLVPAEDDE